MHTSLVGIKSEYVIILSEKEYQSILARDAAFLAVENYGETLSVKMCVQNMLGVPRYGDEGPYIYFTLRTSSISDLPTKLQEIRDIVRDYIDAEEE